MITSLITVSVVGLLTGIVLTIPVAGPVSIYITSHGLKGKVKYCTLAATGAAVIDFIYCFAAVYGLTQLYRSYYGWIPYIFLVGGIFIILIGLRMAKSKIPLDQSDQAEVSDKVRHHGAFWTGFMLNFLNPSLFIGWLVSSFVILSFVASMGIDIGGIDRQLNDNVNVVRQYEDNLKLHQMPETTAYSGDTVKTVPGNYDTTSAGEYFPLFISLAYALSLALGTIVWFYSYSLFLRKNRQILKIPTINIMIKILGLFMTGFGLYLTGKSIYYLFLTFH